ncbi:hypothetical protein [Streptomyces chrestomyceticus]|uniref:hypothetical protein n=1 Tax=Streptomyces chrestomyceticus TaxID=68185 RepID=UPI0033EBCE34
MNKRPQVKAALRRIAAKPAFGVLAAAAGMIGTVCNGLLWWKYGTTFSLCVTILGLLLGGRSAALVRRERRYDQYAHALYRASQSLDAAMRARTEAVHASRTVEEAANAAQVALDVAQRDLQAGRLHDDEEVSRVFKELAARRDRVLALHDHTIVAIAQAEEANMRLHRATVEVERAEERLPVGRVRRWLGGTGADRVSARLTMIALALAGSRRETVRAEWAAHLAGAPEEGFTVRPAARVRYSLGFLLAAFRFRLSDLAAPAWRLVDWVLATDNRVNTAISSVVGAQAIFIVGDGGLQALITEVWEPCGLLGGALYLLVRFLRRRRGIEIAGQRPPNDRSDA